MPTTQCAGFVLPIAVLAQVAGATTIDHGDFSVRNGQFLVTNLTETIADGETARLGTPITTDGSLLFTPTGYEAASAGEAADATAITLHAELSAAPGGGIYGAIVFARGVFSMGPFGAGTNTATAEAQIDLHLTATAVDSVDLPLSGEGAVFGQSGSISQSFNLMESPGQDQPWELAYFIDSGPGLIVNGFGPSSLLTAAELTVTATLQTASESPASASIRVDEYEVYLDARGPSPPITPPFPEPSGAVLLTTAGAACLGNRRGGQKDRPLCPARPARMGRPAAVRGAAPTA